MDRDQLQTFITIVELQSFEKTAAHLSISRGAVSHRIKALESSLSTVLLLREQPVLPTEQGQVLLRHVKALQLLEDATLAQLRPGAACTAVPVAIAVNADSLATWFPAVLWQLLSEPDVALEVVADDQDHTLERLARGEVMGCISTAAQPTTGFVSESLGWMEYRCFATPLFATHHFPNGLNVRDVRKAPALLFNRKDGLHDAFLAAVFGFGVEKYTKHYLPAPQALLGGVAAGVGYGLVPSAQVASLPEGALLDLAPNHPMRVPLYWHHWTEEPPQLQRITSLVKAQASATLFPLPRTATPGSDLAQSASAPPMNPLDEQN